MNFKYILGIQDRRHRLRSHPMYVLFRYDIQTFYTAIIIIIITIIIIIIIIIIVIIIMKLLMVVTVKETGQCNPPFQRVHIWEDRLTVLTVAVVKT